MTPPGVTPGPAVKDTSANIPGQEGSQLTTAMLAAASDEQQKQMLGERIFPRVQEQQVRSTHSVCCCCSRQMTHEQAAGCAAHAKPAPAPCKAACTAFRLTG